MKLAAWTRTGSRVLPLPTTLFAGFLAVIGAIGMSKPEPPAPPCPHCDATMKHVRTIGHLHDLPEIQIFHCAPCEHAETIKLERAA